MTNIRNKVVFLSGPMAGMPLFNVAAFCEAHAMFKPLYVTEVYNPAIEWLKEHHETRTHTLYMRETLRTLIEMSMDYGKNLVLVQLPGWEDSEGARVEAEVAHACGIKVMTLEEALG